MDQQFLAFFVHRLGILDLVVQAFDQLAQLLVVHGKAPPDKNGSDQPILHPYSRTCFCDLQQSDPNKKGFLMFSCINS
jgi:hypothetical protein